MHGAGQMRRAMDPAHVEKGLGVQQGIRFGCLHPGTKGGQPLILGHPPLGVHGHHFPRAQYLARDIKPAADELGQLSKVGAVGGFVIIIRQHECVVLVGGQTHFPAPLGSKHHKGVFHRCRSQLLFAERQKAPGHRISRDGN